MDYKKIYKPNKHDEELINFVNKEVNEMVEVRNSKYTQFNDRTLIEFLDDSEKRVQGYVPSKESQGKDDWQSNVFNQSTRNKLKAFIAAVALRPPEIKIKAVAPNGLPVPDRAEVMQDLVDYSFNRTNPQLSIFWEGWECAAKGTVIKYEGYIKSKRKEKFLTSYNLETGDLSWEEKEVIVKDECVDELVPLSEFFIKDITIPDVQDQPAVAWIRYLNKTDAEFEFGKYKNWKYVKAATLDNSDSGNTHRGFIKNAAVDWQARCKNANAPYETIRYYNKLNDQYIIIVNGVVLLEAPLLWGRKEKYYPFAKTIFEPFSGKNFFYGNSLPNANMDAQDVLNSLYNMLLDKTYRSLTPPLLVGAVNKDLMDLEDEQVGLENTIYVQDVNQIGHLNVPAVNASEMAMLNLAARGMDLGTVDINQQGVAGRGVTAREIVISNEKAKQLKGMFFMFLSDLWYQKTKLRILNILTNYTLPKVEKIEGKKKTLVYKTFLIPNKTLSNGEKGTLAIQFINPEEPIDIEKESQKLAAEERAVQSKGENYEKIKIRADALDDLDYEIQVMTSSMYEKDLAENQAMFSEKLQQVLVAFPDIFQQNKKIFFEDLMKLYNDNANRYIVNTNPNPILPQNVQNTQNPQQPPVSLNKPLTETQKTGMPPVPGLPNITKTPYNK